MRTFSDFKVPGNAGGYLPIGNDSYTSRLLVVTLQAGFRDRSLKYEHSEASVHLGLIGESMHLHLAKRRLGKTQIAGGQVPEPNSHVPQPTTQVPQRPKG